MDLKFDSFSVTDGATTPSTVASASPADPPPACSNKPSMDPAVCKDLQYILRLKRKKIIEQYACYVSRICECVNEKHITVNELRTFVYRLPAFTSDCDEIDCLLSGIKDELEGKNSINKIFDLIGDKCASFLNYTIYQAILDKYCRDIECEEFKYPDKLKAYIDEHSIEDLFKANPQLKKCSSIVKSKELLQLKIDVKPTSKAARVFDLQNALCEILHLAPSALELFSIEEGCVIVTFLIPASVAEKIFLPTMKLTEKQEETLKAFSVLWIKCGSYDYHSKGTCKSSSVCFSYVHNCAWITCIAIYYMTTCHIAI